MKNCKPTLAPPCTCKSSYSTSPSPSLSHRACEGLVTAIWLDHWGGSWAVAVRLSSRLTWEVEAHCLVHFLAWSPGLCPATICSPLGLQGPLCDIDHGQSPVPPIPLRLNSHVHWKDSGLGGLGALRELPVHNVHFDGVCGRDQEHEAEFRLSLHRTILWRAVILQILIDGGRVPCRHFHPWTLP